MTLIYDDEPGSWGRQSENWPKTDNRAYDKFVFLNKLTSPPVNYGSYVLIDSDTSNPKLRVENQKLLNMLEKIYFEAGSPTAKQTMARYYKAVEATVGSSSWPTLDQWW